MKQCFPYIVYSALLAAFSMEFLTSIQQTSGVLCVFRQQKEESGLESLSAPAQESGMYYPVKLSCLLEVSELRACIAPESPSSFGDFALCLKVINVTQGP